MINTEDGPIHRKLHRLIEGIAADWEEMGA